MSDSILITGAATGIGRLTAEALAKAGHTVFASMRDVNGRNRHHAEAIAAFAAANAARIEAIELDILSENSVANAVAAVIDRHGQIDVLIQNAGHLVIGPTEAFSAEELLRSYEVNVVGAHRLNRAVLPHMRQREAGLLVWVSSTTVHGGFPPFLGPYAAAKAAMDSLAGTLAFEVARYGIETTLVTPGAFTSGTEHFPKASPPADSERAGAYARYVGVMDAVGAKLAELMPAEATPQAVAEEIVRVVALPAGRRPFRVVVDFLGDGAAEVSTEADRARAAFAERIGLGDLLKPSLPIPPGQVA